ncbi:hypothetical protein AERO9A_400007 [Aeromonas salmonicida]|nr:hypothetical protein AERO9A_400007 [Aeromonas salmonicida]
MFGHFFGEQAYPEAREGDRTMIGPKRKWQFTGQLVNNDPSLPINRAITRLCLFSKVWVGCFAVSGACSTSPG